MKLPIFILIIGTNAQKKCITCTAQKNHMDVVTQGNGDCFKDGADAEQFEQVCNISEGEGGELWCYNDVEVDWMPAGFQQVNIRRGCRNNNWKDECSEGFTGGYQFKDCHNVCDAIEGAAACNKNTVADALNAFDQGNDITCRECFADDPTNEDELSHCRNNPAPVNHKCPVWANAACFNAKAITTKPQPDEPTEYAYYKGCSTFKINGTLCDEFLNGVVNDAQSCKSTCDVEYCNSGPVIPPVKCYTCDYTWDDFGIIGQGDPNCLNEFSLTSEQLGTCPPDNSYCITELSADWLSRGNQVHRIQRYCSPQPAIAPACVTYNSNDVSNFAYKDCKRSCVGDESREDGATGCNDNNDVEQLFSNGKVNYCQSCHFIEGIGADIGDPKCEDGLSESRQCAIYEDNGCYEAGNWHVDYDEQFGVNLKEHFRGCSSFPEEAIMNQCATMELGGGGDNPVDYTICKNWCDTDDCNNDEIHEPAMCYQCNAVLNQFNDTVGLGSLDCWDDPHESRMVPCEANSCYTQLSVDWNIRGDSLYVIQRGCLSDAYRPPLGASCHSTGDGSGLSFKECHATCNGWGCNDELEEVARKFSVGTVSECYNCFYREADDGAVLGEKHCQDTAEDISKVACPMYLDTSCSSASAVHFNTETLYEEVYKSCSAFDFGEAPCFEQDYQNGTGIAHYDICKVTCRDDNCNKITKHPEVSSSTTSGGSVTPTPTDTPVDPEVTTSSAFLFTGYISILFVTIVSIIL